MKQLAGKGEIQILREHIRCNQPCVRNELRTIKEKSIRSESLLYRADIKNTSTTILVPKASFRFKSSQ